MTGHVQRRGKKSWRLKFDAGRDPLTGKRLTRYRTFNGTKRDAEIELAGYITAVKKGEDIDPSKTTLDEFLDRWQRDWAASNLSPKTLERYIELATTHIRPRLGNARLQKLRPIHFAELYAKLQREGRKRVDAGGITMTMPPLAPRTVGHVHRLLHRALGHAATWGLILSNPVSAVEPPPVESTEVEILTEDQTRAVLQKLRGRNTPGARLLYQIVMLALATGMRRGELLALRWKDVDLEGARLRVEQSLEQTKERGFRFKSPKTKHGRRSITLPASVVAELRAEADNRKRLLAGVPDGAAVDLSLVKLPDDALVFERDSGTAVPPNTVTHDWIRTVGKLKLPPVSFHALRHTHASQLIASGMDVLTISRRLGHGSPSITLGVYGHLFSNSDDRAAKIVEAAFGGVLTD